MSTRVDFLCMMVRFDAMSKAQDTKDRLLAEGRRLFWSRSYSNVSMREIARGADIDVALISRYFGSKRGLFEATMADLPALDPAGIGDSRALVETVVSLFVSAPRGGEMPSPTALILMNAGDPEVGDLVRDAYATHWHKPLETILGDEGKAALFGAAMLGMSVAEKTLRLPGIAAPDTPEYEAQLRALLDIALRYTP